MNTNVFYERRDDRAMPEQPTPQPRIEDEGAALAVHRDPSAPRTATAAETKPQRGIAWVRPSELPTLVGSQWGSRGIDLQSELVRRSRRAPVTATKAGSRISRTAIARPAPITQTVTTTEELGL